MSLRAASGAVLALLLALAVAPARALEIDPGLSRITFSLQTRLGQRVNGTFPKYTGRILSLPDGYRRVEFTLDARAIEIAGSDRYTRITRGDGFFDANRYPELHFRSDAYPESLTRLGGPLSGTLVIRGVQRREVFRIEPAECERPGVDCDVVATGTVNRDDYGIDRWGFAIANRVRFSLKLRLQASHG